MGGGVGGGWVGGVGGGKNSWLEHPWSSHQAHTMVHATLVGHAGGGSNPRSSPANWCPPLLLLFQS